MAIDLQKLVSVDGGTTFVDADTLPGPVLLAPQNPVFRYIVTNIGDQTLTLVAVNDSELGGILVGGTLAPGASTTVDVTGTFAPGQQCNLATATANENGVPVGDMDSACYFGVQVLSIALEKLVSVDGGTTFVEADSLPGPQLVAPQNPVFRYVVTNNSTVTLTGVSVTDSDLGGISVGGVLAPGGVATFQAVGAFNLGPHCNVAHAEGTFNGLTVSDDDTACYTGASGAAIAVQKLVSVDGGVTFVDADVAPGPVLVAPNTPLFRFVITNVGTVQLSNITLVDTDFGPVTLPTTTLAPGASLQVTSSGPFVPGQHTNTATATGQSSGETVTASDAANFVGVSAVSIGLQKLVSVNNGATFVDANSPPGPTLVSPTKPLFRFVITNNGGATLTNVTLTDSTLGPITLPTTTLAPGQVIDIALPGTFAAGIHCNLATATGTAIGLTVSDSDSACYRGAFSPLPEFPDISNPAPQDEIIDRLLETIALEELALAALINAEAEKVQAVVAAGIAGPVDAEELEAINLAVAEVIRLAGVKEQHLRRKLVRLLAHKEQQGAQPPAP